MRLLYQLSFIWIVAIVLLLLTFSLRANDSAQFNPKNSHFISENSMLRKNNEANSLRKIPVMSLPATNSVHPAVALPKNESPWFEYALIDCYQDTNWYNLDQDGTVELSSLSSGTYQVAFRKAGNGTPYEYEYINIVVPQAFYEKPAFRLLMLLLLVCSIIVYTRLRLKNIKRKNVILRTMVKSHTQRLQHALEALTVSESNLRKHTHVQGRLISAITHDIKSPLKYMTMASGQLVADIQQDANKSAMLQHAKMLYDANYRVQLLTENLLQYIKLHAKGKEITCEKINAYDIIEDKVNMFRAISFEQSSTIVNNIPSQFFINSHSKLLGVIIHNLLDNATKVTSKGTITISSALTDKHAQIIIRDTGFGMPASIKKWFNRTDHRPGEIEEHTGLGLVIVKELMDLINGLSFAESSEYGGTVITLSFERQLEA